MSWLVYTHIRIGKISAANLSSNYALLTGSVVSLGLSILICVVVSLVWPDKEPFQWETFTKVPPPPLLCINFSLRQFLADYNLLVWTFTPPLLGTAAQLISTPVVRRGTIRREGRLP